MTPSTVTQLALLVAFVLPGTVYQTVRARLAGEAPANRDLTNRLLRALTASVVLDSLYGIVLGPTLLHAIGPGTGLWGTPVRSRREWWSEHARTGSLLALLLLFVVPTVVAFAATRWHPVGARLARLREHGPLSTTGNGAHGRAAINRALAHLGVHCAAQQATRYDSTPAWNWAVTHGGTTEGGFVRVHTPSGWRGGQYGGHSFFSTYPETPAVFVEQAWRFDPDGNFLHPLDGTNGAWVPCETADTVEFFRPDRTTRVPSVRAGKMKRRC